jgi:DNA-binding SARP family transcriptional activator
MNERNTHEQTRPSLRIWLCGPLQIAWVDPATGEDRLVPESALRGTDAPQALSLLKLLLCRPARQAHRDWILEQFWPEQMHSAASHRFDNITVALRKLLRTPDNQPLLRSASGKRSNGTIYSLPAYPFLWVDVDALSWNMEQAARMERFGEDALPFWQRAYDLLKRGPFLGDEPYADWARARRELLEGYSRQCVHALWRCYVARGGDAGKAEALVLLFTYWQQQKTDEDVLRPLMELLGEQERYQETEDYYQQLLQALAQEEPTDEGQPREPDARTQDVREFLRLKQIQRTPASSSLGNADEQERSASFTAAQKRARVIEATVSPLSDDHQLMLVPDDHLDPAGPLLSETRHLLGRQEWLASVIALIEAEIPKKLLVLHGPIGVGKSSELNRLAYTFVQQNTSQVVVLSLPVREPRDPEASLDLFVGMLLSSSRAAPFPADASRQTRIKLALTALAQRPQPTVILLDNAEGTLTEEGTLVPCWEAFLTNVVRGQHQATLILATKEWPGWPGRDSQLVAEIVVPPLTLEESVLLLQRLGLESVPLAALEAISQRVACIPLCLEWIATIAHDPLVHDEWEGWQEQEETSTESRLDAIAQRLAYLLQHPTLLGEHLASRLTPLLEHIIEKHLSTDARRVLEHLAVVSIPLGKPALHVFCSRPAWLKELRSARYWLPTPTVSRSCQRSPRP